MIRIKYLFFILIYGLTNSVFSQDTLDLNQVYSDNDLVYKMNGELFSGVAQKKRKNGHLVYEEIYQDGVIQFSNLYFNTKEKIISDKIIYNSYNPWVVQKEIRFHLSTDTLVSTDYDDSGKKILLTQFENNRVIYTCQYDGRKKNGLALGFANGDGKITYRCEYANGKKNGEEFCVNEDGTQWTKKFRNGKRIK